MLRKGETASVFSFNKAMAGDLVRLIGAMCIADPDPFELVLRHDVQYMILCYEACENVRLEQLLMEPGAAAYAGVSTMVLYRRMVDMFAQHDYLVNLTELMPMIDEYLEFASQMDD